MATFFCNKCGYVGPNARNHKKPPYYVQECNYEAAAISKATDEELASALKELKNPERPEGA